MENKKSMVAFGKQFRGYRKKDVNRYIEQRASASHQAEEELRAKLQAQSEETDALLDSYRATRGEKRSRAASALWAKLGEEAPIIPLCFKNGSLLTRWGQVRGLSPTQQNAFYGMENWRVTP